MTAHNPRISAHYNCWMRGIVINATDIHLPRPEKRARAEELSPEQRVQLAQHAEAKRLREKPRSI